MASGNCLPRSFSLLVHSPWGFPVCRDWLILGHRSWLSGMTLRCHLCPRDPHGFVSYVHTATPNNKYFTVYRDLWVRDSGRAQSGSSSAARGVDRGFSGGQLAAALVLMSLRPSSVPGALWGQPDGRAGLHALSVASQGLSRGLQQGSWAYVTAQGSKRPVAGAGSPLRPGLEAGASAHPAPCPSSRSGTDSRGGCRPCLCTSAVLHTRRGRGSW